MDEGNFNLAGNLFHNILPLYVISTSSSIVIMNLSIQNKVVSIQSIIQTFIQVRLSDDYVVYLMATY